MLFVTRKQWGARPPNTSVGGFSSKKGFQLHHYASPRALEDHGGCAGQMRNVQTFHMDGRGWSDIAYNFVICNHGHVFEGRGWVTQNGASGNASANDTRLAICWAGHSDLDTFDIKAADAIKELVSEGIGKGWPATVGGHRDFSETTCPGNTLYNWMKVQVWTLTPTPTPVPLTPIMGVAGVLQSQALTAVLSGAAKSGGAVYEQSTLSAIVSAYWTVGQVEGVRPDLALAQACKETGYFTYRKPDGSSSIVSADQHNFAGIGVTGAAGVKGESWPTVADGVRGHVRRLRMYAVGTAALHDLSILRRSLPSSYWASAPYVEQLNGKWASPGVGYGESIVNAYLKPMSLVEVPVTDPPSDWAKEAWEWATVAGVVRGTQPSSQVTAEQVITFIHRART